MGGSSRVRASFRRPPCCSWQGVLRGVPSPASSSAPAPSPRARLPVADNAGEWWTRYDGRSQCRASGRWAVQHTADATTSGHNRAATMMYWSLCVGLTAGCSDQHCRLGFGGRKSRDSALGALSSNRRLSPGRGRPTPKFVSSPQILQLRLNHPRNSAQREGMTTALTPIANQAESNLNALADVAATLHLPARIAPGKPFIERGPEASTCRWRAANEPDAAVRHPACPTRWLRHLAFGHLPARVRAPVRATSACLARRGGHHRMPEARRVPLRAAGYEGDGRGRRPQEPGPGLHRYSPALPRCPS